MYAMYDNDVLKGYELNYRICDEARFNTLTVNFVVENVLHFIKNPKGKHIIGYKQPSLDILIVTFDNLIYKLALMQSVRWKRLEFDDLYQTCRLTLCNLYNKGYYIHKTLLAKAFENEVLMEMRKYIDEPDFVSLEQPVECSDDNLIIRDTIHDYRQEEREQDEEDLFIQLCIFDDVRSIVEDMIGKRGFEQLYRDYKNKCTTTWSRATMHRISKKFKDEGLTKQTFLNKYGRK